MEWTFIIVFAVLLAAAIAGFRILHSLYQEVTIWDYQVGLHYKHGQYRETLKAGRHRLWGQGHGVVLYDTRLMEMVVKGQELLTADDAPVTVSAVANYRIADALKVSQAAQNPVQLLYGEVQLALRRVIGAEELDAVLQKKAAFGQALFDQVVPRAAALGYEVDSVDVRDLSVSGELKRVCAGVLQARKEALAELERARGQAAALRTLANAARVYEKNPGLVRLRYLDVVEKSAQGMGNTIVVGGPEKWTVEVAP